MSRVKILQMELIQNELFAKCALHSSEGIDATELKCSNPIWNRRSRLARLALSSWLLALGSVDAFAATERQLLRYPTI